MTLAAGSRLGPYEILAPLGAGGMGEVWRARDTKLGREVALKVLPQAVAVDAERLARFEREAQLLAALNHPHIAAIYGVEDSTETKALVLELVEGETLQERIAHGPLPVEEAVAIARQIAEALEAAHEKGVIHRDLKPANVKLTANGDVKVLDFGLAKALDPGATSSLSPSASSTLMNSPTLTAAGTQLGVILGTAAYMAPEQARGKTVDKRADVWALGCLIWEMLTGQRLYEGETVSDTIAAVLTRTPEWSALPTGTPAALRELLRRLLERDPRSRLHDVADARIFLDDIAAGRLPEPAATSTARAAHPALRATPWAIALLALGVAGWAAWRSGPVRESPALRFAISSPEGTTVAFEDNYPALEFSPDGRRLAFIARDARGARHLYVRELGEIEPREIPGGLEARAPFFSPDGRSLGFFTFGELKRVSLDGGTPAVLAQVENARGAAWVDDSTIVFPTATDSPLYRLSASGGAAVPLTTLDAARNERTHRWPAPFPGGVLFTCDTFESTEFYDDARIEAVSLDGARRAVVVERASFARYLPSGELIFARGGSLYAVRFDAKTFRTQGDPVVVWQGVSTRVSSGAVQFAATADILAYVAGGLSTESGSVAWFRHDGPAEPLDIPQANQVQEVRLSPDGGRLAIITSASPSADLWVIDLARSMSNRLSFEGNSWDPVFSPDGKSIAFASARGGARYRPYLKAADGSGAERLLWESEEPAFPSSFSPDGKWLALEVRSRSSASDIWMLALDGSAPPRPFVATRDIEWQPVFSPDGKWLAYAANSSGTNQVYVRPFPGPGGLWQLSTGGGEGPRWSSDGRKIYYRFELDIYEIDVDTSHGFAAGQPRRIVGGTVATTFNNSFDVAPDGQRVVALHVPPERERRQISILFDWPAQLRRALGR
jgi:serine/threonine-protein kinase